MSPAAHQPAAARIGVIGDVHGEHERLAAALEFLTAQRLDHIICTGDLADGDGELDLCCQLLDAADVLTVRGNHDRWLLQDRIRHIPNAHQRGHQSDATLAWLDALPTQLQIDTTDGTLLLCHGVADNDLRKVWPGTERMPVERSAELDAIIDSGDVQLVVNGHMHYRVVIDFETLTLINAGTLRSTHRPGISIIDTIDGSVSAYEFGADHACLPVPNSRWQRRGRAACGATRRTSTVAGHR